jgi:hypothetical protein
LQALKNSNNCLSIHVKPVDLSRARDQNKHHGGSAILEFSSPREAVAALKALQCYSDINKSNYRLKYAIQHILKPEPAPLTTEDLERRKERAASYARRRVRVAERTDRVLERLLDSDDSILQQTVPILQADPLDWSKCPADIDPMQGGGLQQGSDRAERKRAAVEAFFSVIHAIMNTPDTSEDLESFRIADLGSGSGNLALPLQWWLMNNEKESGVKSFDMVAVDYNAESLDRLMDRSQLAGISVQILKQDLRHLISSNQSQGHYEAIVSLHACGAASDMAMAVAVARDIPFGISPCCIGKVNKWRSPPHGVTSRGMLSPFEDFSYPRSRWLQQAVTTDEYQLLAKSADYGVVYDKNADAEEMKRRERCRMAKRVVEMDRLEWAREHGYEVQLVELPRIGQLYPKRELLLGAPKGSHSAERIKQLQNVK